MRRHKHRGLRRRYGHASGSEVQSLLFPKSTFTVSEAKDWAKEHDFKSSDVDTHGGYIHVRQMKPSDFKRMRTVAFGAGGVEARVGWEK